MSTSIPLTHGQALRGAMAGDFRLLETRHGRGMELGLHEHEHACINFVLAGGYSETLAGGSAVHGPLASLFKPAGQAHANRFRDAGARCLLVELQGDTPPDVDVLRPRDTRDPAAAVVALRLWYELARPDESTGLNLEELSHEYYARTLVARRAAASGTTRLRRVAELLHDGPGESWSLTPLAVEVGLHPSHLARAFRAAYGRTIGDYLREVRVGRVARGLAGSTRSIADLAAEAGFCDQSHCTRAFRRLLGTTPAAFRQVLSR